MFISFEGLDGSGKTTHAQLLADFLRAKGKDVLLTREPGGTLLSEKIRELLLSRDMSPRTKTFLFSAARCHHVEEIIRPALKNSIIVICDRYIDSTVAYQGINQMECALAYTANEFSSYGLYPDLSFYLDISPEKSVERSHSKDMVDSGDITFLSGVVQRYRQEMKNNPERWVSVCTHIGSLELNQKVIKRKVIEFIQEKRGNADRSEV